MSKEKLEAGKRKSKVVTRVVKEIGTENPAVKRLIDEEDNVGLRGIEKRQQSEEVAQTNARSGSE